MDDGEAFHADLLHVEAKYDGTAATIIVEGELDMAGSDPFKAAVREVLESRPESITVDARGLTFVDSSGLTALLLARAAAQDADIPFRITEPSPALWRVAELGGVGDLLADE